MLPSSKQTASQTANSVSSYPLAKYGPQRIKKNFLREKVKDHMHEAFLLQSELEELNVNLENNDVFLAKSKATSPKQKKELCLSAQGLKAYKTSIWG